MWPCITHNIKLHIFAVQGKIGTQIGGYARCISLQVHFLGTTSTADRASIQ